MWTGRAVGALEGLGSLDLVFGEAALAADLATAWKTLQRGCASSQLDHGSPIAKTYSLTLTIQNCFVLQKKKEKRIHMKLLDGFEWLTLFMEEHIQDCIPQCKAMGTFSTRTWPRLWMDWGSNPKLL